MQLRVLIIGLIALTVTGCSQQPTVTPTTTGVDTSTWSTYKNNEFDISFLYPPEHYVKVSLPKDDMIKNPTAVLAVAHKDPTKGYIRIVIASPAVTYPTTAEIETFSSVPGDQMNYQVVSRDPFATTTAIGEQLIVTNVGSDAGSEDVGSHTARYIFLDHNNRTISVFNMKSETELVDGILQTLSF